MSLKDRYTAQPMGAAYQGAMESVLSIVVGVLLGWWADSSFGTSPWGVLVGATIGFGAFVLRLSRLAAAMSTPSEDETSPKPGGGDQAGQTERDDRPG